MENAAVYRRLLLILRYPGFSSRAKYSGANGRGSTSANGARSKCDFSAQGTVQSKMVLQLMPFPRIDGLYSGVWDGSSW